VPQAEDLVADGWTSIIQKLLLAFTAGRVTDTSPGGLMKAAEIADFQKMEEIRARVDAVVKDPAVAEALKPYYRQFCKRPCFHNEYLETFNRANVTLVDTKGRGVDRITARGVVVDGREYQLDCLIYASGFEVGTDFSHRAGFTVHGRGGRTLTDKWTGGTRTLHGVHVSGFPNCFIMSNAQAGFTASYPHLLNEQAKHLAYVVKTAAERDARIVEATPEGEQEWVDTCIRKARNVGDFFENCTPGYYNNEGKPSERSAQDGFYGGGPVEFFKILDEWRAAGELAGLKVD